MKKGLLLIWCLICLFFTSCDKKETAEYLLVVYSSESTCKVVLDNSQNEEFLINGFFEQNISIPYSYYTIMKERTITINRINGNDTIYIYAAGLSSLVQYNGKYLSGRDIIRQYSENRMMPIDSLSLYDIGIHKLLPKENEMVITPTFYIK